MAKKKSKNSSPPADQQPAAPPAAVQEPGPPVAVETPAAPRTVQYLATIKEFHAYNPRLRRLGIGTLEAFIGAAEVARPELEAFLETSIEKLLSNLPVAASAIPAQALAAIQTASYPLGVALDHIPRQLVAHHYFSLQGGNGDGNGDPLPDTVNMVSQMPPIRDQGQRGTCVAFAALAAYEHALRTAGSIHDLSEEFLYWNCKRNDGIPNIDGTFLQTAYPSLQRDGCCPEANWAYDPIPTPGNLGQGPPPGGAQIQALTYRLVGFHHLAATSVPDIKATLAAGRCVSISIPVFNSWYGSKDVAYTGDITLPIPGEIRHGGHAICLVGYVDSPNDTPLGGGRFIVRNSWGTTNWGVASPYGPGYGTIPYSYITRLATEAFSPN